LDTLSRTELRAQWPINLTNSVSYDLKITYPDSTVVVARNVNGLSSLDVSPLPQGSAPLPPLGTYLAEISVTYQDGSVLKATDTSDIVANFSCPHPSNLRFTEENGLYYITFDSPYLDPIPYEIKVTDTDNGDAIVYQTVVNNPGKHQIQIPALAPGATVHFAVTVTYYHVDSGDLSTCATKMISGQFSKTDGTAIPKIKIYYDSFIEAHWDLFDQNVFDALKLKLVDITAHPFVEIDKDGDPFDINLVTADSLYMWVAVPTSMVHVYTKYFDYQNNAAGQIHNYDPNDPNDYVGKSFLMYIAQRMGELVPGYNFYVSSWPSTLLGKYGFLD